MKSFTFLYFVLFVLFMFNSQAQSNVEQNSVFNVTILRSDLSGLDVVIETNLPDFQLVKTPRGVFNTFVFSGGSLQGSQGSPALPVYSSLIRLPEGAEWSLTSVPGAYTDYSLSDLTGNAAPLFPFQPDVLKSHQGDVPFYFNEQIYKEDALISNNFTASSELGYLRHLRLGKIMFSPFAYNPATGVLRVFHKVKLSVSFPGASAMQTTMKEKKYADYLFSASENLLLNNDAFRSTKDTTIHYPVHFVIVADTVYHDALQPFVEWKTKKGFIVTEAYTNNAQVGSTTTSISAYLQGLYDNATPTLPAPGFILFAGDVAQVPAFNGTTGSHVTDLYYAEFTGDMIADAYYGRFSAADLADMNSQIDKTLEYEQYLFPQEAWLDTVVMIAGVDGSWAATHANGQINYGNTYYFNTSNGITSLTHLYPNSGSDDALIRTEIGRGVSFANYTAHGYEDGWGDPGFDKSQITDMQNAHQYPLMVGNACLTNSFQQPECFGEALLRAEQKGAIGYIGGSNSTYWNEDFYWGVGFRSTVTANPLYESGALGAYDRTWHTAGQSFSEWYMSQGQMIMAGNLAVLQGGSSFDYYSEIYHLMGDPSLMVYFGVPSQLNVSHPALVPLGQTSISVTTEPYAYIGITQNGVWHGAGIADASGNATINIIPFTVPGSADIVGTKQFRKPFIGSIIVQSPSGPYVLYHDNTVSDPTGNNNSAVDFMEVASLNVNLKNYGTQNDSTVYAVLSSNDPYIEITDSLGVWGIIASMDTLRIPMVFEISTDTVIPDQHMAAMSIMVRDSSGNVWPGSFNMLINAPLPEIQNLVIDDAAGNGNGKLDPGETVELHIGALNTGHADVWNANAVLSTTSPYITIIDATHQHDSLYVGVAETGVYNISVDNAAPLGSVATFTLILEALGYCDTAVFNKNIGIVNEDWESGDLSQYQWQTSGNAPWIITSGNPYEGAFAAISGDINDDQTSVLSLEVNVLSEDTISFYKKVSCEEGWGTTLYDGLDFSVDGTSLGVWGGEVPWGKEAFLLLSGVHELTWTYFKDGSISSGNDAAWLDYIIFPPIQIISSTQNFSVVNEIKIYPNPATNGNITVSANVPAGDVDLRVFSSDGQLVYTTSYSNVADGIILLPLDVNSWQPGVYTLALQSTSGYFCTPFTVLNQ